MMFWGPPCPPFLNTHPPPGFLPSYLTSSILLSHMLSYASTTEGSREMKAVSQTTVVKEIHLEPQSNTA